MIRNWKSWSKCTQSNNHLIRKSARFGMRPRVKQAILGYVKQLRHKSGAV